MRTLLRFCRHSSFSALWVFTALAFVAYPIRAAVTEAWVQRRPAPFNENWMVAVDRSGNVLVTGPVLNNLTNSQSDFYTAKYAAEDGVLLWERRYDGPINGNDRAKAAAVDGNGDVIVLGLSREGPPNYYGYFYTAKYSAMDGALLWEQRYRANEEGDEPNAHGLALGPDGMVVVAGSSIGSGEFYDVATIVYREHLPPVSLDRTATGSRLRFPGVAGHSYQLLRAAALTGPWSTNATFTAITNGIIEYIDTNAPPGSAFYRTSTGP